MKRNDLIHAIASLVASGNINLTLSTERDGDSYGSYYYIRATLSIVTDEGDTLAEVRAYDSITL